VAASIRPRERVRESGDRWLIATLVALAAAFAILVYLGRGLTFWYDEWQFIEVPGLGTLHDWLAPHNEHWWMLPFILYRATFSIVGLHSYIPYLAELLIVHLVAVAGVAALVRRDLGPLPAFVAILPLLLLGSGWVNLFWAFQTGFVGSTAAGVWAIYALATRGRHWTLIGALLLLAAVTCSGIGLFWLVAVAVELALDPPRRPRLVAVVPAVVTYAAWYVAYGAAAVTQMDASPLSLRNLLDVPAFVVLGVSTAAGAFGGFGRPIGLIAFTALVAVAAVGLVRRAVPPRALAALIGVVVMYGTIGLVRVRFGSDYAVQPRYVYVAAFFLVVCISSTLRPLRADGHLGRVVSVGVVALVAISVVSGAFALREGKHRAEGMAKYTRAFVGAAVDYAGAPWVDPTRRAFGMPLPNVVPGLVRQAGDPRRDTLVPWLVGKPLIGDADGAKALLFGRNFRAQLGSPPTTPAVLHVIVATNVDIQPVGGCLIGSSTLAGGFVTLWVPGGGVATVTATATAEVVARIGRGGAQRENTRIAVPLTAGDTTAILVPDTGDGPWQLKLDLPTDRTRLCVSNGGE
jgi:hypothetical protein